MRKIFTRVVALYCSMLSFPAKGLSQCANGYTQSQLNWDFLDYLVTSGSYSGFVTNIMASNQHFMKMRFVFTSDANTTGYDFQVDDGFNIDDLKLVKSANSLPPLPLTYINLNGKLRTDHLVELKWQAETGHAQNRFIIEKSANGTSYSEIGISENRNVYIDHFPVSGNNYYRIRSVMNNGDTIYSQVVNVIWKPESNITIYPNPVFDDLNIRINNLAMEVSKVLVTDLRGQVLFTKSSENGIKSDLKIQTGDWVPQIYTVTLLNNKNEILEVKKFLRQ